MATMPDHLRFTAAEQAKLDELRSRAKVRHELARKAAARLGRNNFPMLPYECSWAFEEEFRRAVRR